MNLENIEREIMKLKVEQIKYLELFCNKLIVYRELQGWFKDKE